MNPEISITDLNVLFNNMKLFAGDGFDPELIKAIQKVQDCLNVKENVEQLNEGYLGSISLV